MNIEQQGKVLKPGLVLSGQGEKSVFGKWVDMAVSCRWTVEEKTQPPFWNLQATQENADYFHV